MKRLLFLLLPTSLALTFSCKKSDNTPVTPTPVLKTDSATLNLGGVSGSLDSFSVQSNINWTISISPATTTWLKTGVTSGSGNGKIMITALEANTGTTIRTATITLTATGNTAVQPVTITVNQKTVVYSLMWSKVFGGTLSDLPQNAIKTADGGFLMVGNTSSNDGDVTGQRGNGDAWLVKTDANGTKLWQKTYGGSGTDYAYAVVASAEGGYVVAGYTGSPNGDISGYHSGGDAWVMKLDATGNILWSKAFGGTLNEQLHAVASTSDGGYVLTGFSYSNNGDVTGHRGTTGTTDAWVLKLDPNGNIQWQKSLGGTTSEQAHSVLATSDGGCLFTGFTASTDGDVSGNHGVAGTFDAWVVKLDAAGSLQWQKAFGGTSGEICYSIAPSGDGNYVLTGSTGSNDGDMTGLHGSNSQVNDGWVLKMDGNGNKIWVKLFGGLGSDAFKMIAPAADGGFVMNGVTNSSDGDVSGLHGAQDAWVLKIDAAGNKQWQRALGGSASESGYAVIPLSDGSFVLLANSQSNDGDISGALGSSDFWLSKVKVQ